MGSQWASWRRQLLSGTSGHLAGPGIGFSSEHGMEVRQSPGWSPEASLCCRPLLVRPPHPEVHAEAGSWVRQSAQCPSCSSSTASVSTLCAYTHLTLTTTFQGCEYSKKTSSSTPMTLPSYRGGN